MEKSIHTPLYDAFRRKLKSLRRKAGLTQRDLAKRLKRVPSVIAHIEMGERRVDFVEFFWICQACGADPVKVSAEILRDFKSRQKKRGR